MTTKPSKPSKPSKPVAKKAETKPRKARGPGRTVKLTDEQLATCQRIADAKSKAAFGVAIPPVKVAEEALRRGLQMMVAEGEGTDRD